MPCDGGARLHEQIEQPAVALTAVRGKPRYGDVSAERACRVTVSPDQLSLAIGREGQNVRLAARLTGCKIDIKTD